MALSERSDWVRRIWSITNWCVWLTEVPGVKWNAPGELTNKRENAEVVFTAL
jgi:hypothetical protein